MSDVILMGLLYPFLGTVIGSAFVFFMKNIAGKKLLIALDSVAAGIMCAASFFSLISPAVSQAESRNSFSLFSCSLGFLCGMLLFIVIDIILKKSERKDKKLSKNMLIWAVTLHNVPEGMAVGVILAGYIAGNPDISAAGTLSLSFGIALQNIPEGAIISLPLKAGGCKALYAFFKGLVSGVAELAAGILTLFLSAFIVQIMPFCLCFAAGAMIYVVLAELSSSFSKGENRSFSLFLFDAGFIVMMLLDTFLG